MNLVSYPNGVTTYSPGLASRLPWERCVISDTTPTGLRPAVGNNVLCEIAQPRCGWVSQSVPFSQGSRDGNRGLEDATALRLNTLTAEVCVCGFALQAYYPAFSNSFRSQFANFAAAS